ncbi:MAG: CDP-diacylglycerol--serine O-phosphatidyltransferase [Pirellulales bacterium]|nr:CDP-diacylglycerol--serine O-phosphatidyltransferase [Pirellulales bacterium]
MSELKRGLHADLEPPDPPADDVANLDDPGDEKPRRRRFRRKRKRKRRRLTLAVLPTLLTLSNGVCGLSAIAIATSVNLNWENEQKLLVAGILIFVGMLFDALDGSAARMTGQASEFGAQLDSLCDVITFGTAPTVIVWHINEGNALPQKLALAIGVLFTLCVIMRLARFNVETSEEDTHDGFDGLPSPAAAGTVAALVIALPELASYDHEDYPERIRLIASSLVVGSQYFIPIIALLLAYLMVSRFHYPHVFQQLLRGRKAPHQIGQALFVVIGALLLHWLALPLAFCYYAFASPVKSLLKRWRTSREVASPI